MSELTHSYPYVLPHVKRLPGANTDGTVYFSAPLYRKNLHYSVLPKPSSANSAIKNMADYILKHHPNATGIVYCLSKKVIYIICRTV